MKAKTRLKLAARGLGPLVRPGRPGRGRRGALAPERGAEASDAAAGTVAGEAQPVVRDGGPLGEFLEPPAGSVRQRVRLRPAVREALDIEAERVGMTREALCRVVLEEIARKAVADSGADPADPEDVSVIPAGYVGGAGDEEDDAPSAGADPAEAGDAPGPGVAGELAADEGSPARALLRVRRRRVGDAVPVRPVRGVRRLGRFTGRHRLRGAWVAVLAFVLGAVLSIGAAAASWRYEALDSAGDGFYVLDHWRGAVWRCGVDARGRPPACAQAVFRQPSVGGEVAYMGRVSR